MLLEKQLQSDPHISGHNPETLKQEDDGLNEFSLGHWSGDLIRAREENGIKLTAGLGGLCWASPFIHSLFRSEKARKRAGKRENVAGGVGEEDALARRRPQIRPTPSKPPVSSHLHL
jgi:hypothetical protein